jgi:group I intron endonuclease
MININCSFPIIGIYKITSPSGKTYIGQSTNIKIRWDRYKRLACKSQRKLYNSLKKYGPENHKFDKIEECSIEQLNEREVFYKQQHIDHYGWKKALFHEIYDRGGGPKSEKTKEKISKSSLGKPKSQKHKNNIKNAKLGAKFSQEHCNNMSKTRFKYSILCLETGVIYKSANQASKELNVAPISIINVCKGIFKQAKGYTFKFSHE